MYEGESPSSYGGRHGCQRSTVRTSTLGKHRHATASQLRNNWKLRTTGLPIKLPTWGTFRMWGMRDALKASSPIWKLPNAPP